MNKADILNKEEDKINHINMLIKVKRAIADTFWYSGFINSKFFVYRQNGNNYLWVTNFLFIKPEDVEECYGEDGKDALLVSFLPGNA